MKAEPVQSDAKQRDADAAILECLRDLNVKPGECVNLYRIGPPLEIGLRYTEDEILQGLYSLRAAGKIDLLADNRLKLLSALDSNLLSVMLRQ